MFTTVSLLFYHQLKKMNIKLFFLFALCLLVAADPIPESSPEEASSELESSDFVSDSSSDEKAVRPLHPFLSRGKGPIPIIPSAVQVVEPIVQVEAPVEAPVVPAVDE